MLLDEGCRILRCRYGSEDVVRGHLAEVASGDCGLGFDVSVDREGVGGKDGAVFLPHFFLGGHPFLLF
jgi:hypothetical protein